MGINIGHFLGGGIGSLLGSGNGSGSPFWQAALPIAGAALGGPAGAAAGSGVASGLAAQSANSEDWDRTKWLLNYNTPLNQRKRFEEAGLNPALMYGGAGASSAGNAGTSAPSVRPVNMAGGMPQAIEAYLQYTMMDKRLQLMDADIALKAQNTVTSQTSAALNRFKVSDELPSQIYARSRDTYRKDAMLPFGLQGAQLSNDKTAQEINNLKAQYDGTILDNTRKDIENSNLDQRLKGEVQLILSKVVSEQLEWKVKEGTITRQNIENAVSKEFEGMARKGVLKTDMLPARMLGLLVDRISNYFKL